MCCRLGAVSFQVDSWAYGEIWIWLDVVLGSSLVDVLVYGKCRIMSDARRMFDEIENLNAITWNVIVRRWYHEMGNEKEAVVMFSKMIRAYIRPLNFTFSNSLLLLLVLVYLHSRRGFTIQIHGVRLLHMAIVYFPFLSLYSLACIRPHLVHVIFSF